MGAAQFGSTFFMITGFHGMHVTAGVIYLSIVALKVGRGDYDDAVAAERHYCEMVEGKLWPAYNPNINCEE